MSSVISASTTSTTALTLSGDTSGQLEIKTGSTPSTAVTITSGQNTTFAQAINAPNTFGFKNRIINGAMVIDQRNAGASVTPTNGQYIIDRYFASLSQASKFSVQQNAGSVTPPTGFINYLGVTSLSAYSVLTSDTFSISQSIEGFNTADLAWGTANAKTVTLSFWVRSSLTGTFGGSFANSAVARSYPFTYSISSANTWEQKSITVAGDTSGTWLTDNGIGVRIWFGLGSGSTYSGTAGAWAGADYRSATGATSVVGTNGATLYITGVQLEVGSAATSFDYRPYGTELALCQRYYERYALGANTIICPMQCYSTSAAFGGPIKYTVTKRATPTITLPTAGSGSGEAALSTSTGSFPGTIGTHSISGETVDMARVNATGYTGAFTAGDASMYLSTNSGTAVIQISAEL